MRSPFLYHRGEICRPADFLHRNEQVAHFLFRIDNYNTPPLNGILNPETSPENRIEISPWNVMPWVVVSVFNGTCTRDEASGCRNGAWNTNGCTNSSCPKLDVPDMEGGFKGFLKMNRVVITQFVNHRNNEYAWFPFTFVDQGMGLATYRELFGFQVHQADIGMMNFNGTLELEKFLLNVVIPNPPRLTNTNGASRNSVSLLKIESVPVSDPSDIARQGLLPATGTAAYLKEFLYSSFSGGGSAIIDIPPFSHVIRHLMGEMDIVSLRQFRSGQDGGEARPQNLQLTRHKSFTMHSGGTVRMDFKATLRMPPPPCDIHFPMMKTVFRSTESTVELTSKAMIWMNVDYQYQPMEEGWEGIL